MTSLLVHFGIRKTGSSSIQETLLNNASRLEATRYLAFGMANSSLMVRDSSAGPKGSRPTGGRCLRAASPRAYPNSGAPRRLSFPPKPSRTLTFLLCARSLHPVILRGSDRFIGYIRDPVGYQRSVFQEHLKYLYDGFFPDGPLRI